MPRQNAPGVEGTGAQSENSIGMGTNMSDAVNLPRGLGTRTFAGKSIRLTKSGLKPSQTLAEAGPVDSGTPEAVQRPKRF